MLSVSYTTIFRRFRRPSNDNGSCLSGNKLFDLPFKQRTTCAPVLLSGTDFIIFPLGPTSIEFAANFEGEVNSGVSGTGTSA